MEKLLTGNFSTVTKYHRADRITRQVIRRNELEEFQQKIGHAFLKPEVLRRALTHKSYSNENPSETCGHNERLEFLGDAVLDLSISHLLMTEFPEMDEGDLSKIRASLVNEQALSKVAGGFGLEKHMRLGKGEAVSGGAAKPRLLASVFEALVGSIFQDGGFQKADTFICTAFAERIKNLDLSQHYSTDYKTRLQEGLQTKYKKTPEYKIEKEEGPDHDKTFFVNVSLDGRILASGQGKSKKQAEQVAAELALENLK